MVLASCIALSAHSVIARFSAASETIISSAAAILSDANCSTYASFFSALVALTKLPSASALSADWRRKTCSSASRKTFLWKSIASDLSRLSVSSCLLANSRRTSAFNSRVGTLISGLTSANSTPCGGRGSNEGLAVEIPFPFIDSSVNVDRSFSRSPLVSIICGFASENWCIAENRTGERS